MRIQEDIRKPFSPAMSEENVTLRGKPRRHRRETKGGEDREDSGDGRRDNVLYEEHS
jgi:hypothetical protein